MKKKLSILAIASSVVCLVGIVIALSKRKKNKEENIKSDEESEEEYYEEEYPIDKYHKLYSMNYESLDDDN